VHEPFEPNIDFRHALPVLLLNGSSRAIPAR
jgi:hypothetical protein